MGINLSQWDDNAEFEHKNSNGVTYCVQDYYKVDSPGNNKLKQIENQVFNAENGNPNTLYINFTSGTNIPLDNPENFARNINPRFTKFLIDNPSQKRIGIIAMDFCNYPDSLIKQILSYNTWV